MTDTCALLRGPGLSCKVITSTGVEPAGHYRWYEAQAVPVSDLQELVRVLSLAVQDPHVFIVRGTPKDGRTPIRRTHAHAKAMLEDTPHHWLALDLDSTHPRVPAAEFAADPGRYAQAVRSMLPPEWARASSWWQATGSAGIKPGVRLRLVFWLDQALTCVQARALVKSLPVPADLALYTPSQPMYTARPVFSGIPDPVSVREGVLPGDPCVRVQAAGGQAQALTRACERVSKAKEGERRNVLNAQAFRLARTTPLDPEHALAALVQASTLPADEARACAEQALADGAKARAEDTDGWRVGLVRGKSGEPSATQGNVILYLLNHDAFTGLAMDGTRVLWLTPPPGETEPRSWRDTDAALLVLWFQEQAHIQAQSAWCSSAASLAASRKPINRVQEYLDALPEWDGTVRLDTFFVRHWGVQDSQLVRAQSSIWFIQAARRARATLDEPVSFQYMIVLQGPGGLRKSLGLKALCEREEWFRDMVPDMREKDAALAMLDSWIVEMAELTHRRADQDLVKAFLTRSVEKFRPPYGRETVILPRRCAVIGTSNESAFLTDPTGNRRYWPMVCTRRADLGEIARERDQVWAEAQARCEEQAWLTDALERDAAYVQEAHEDTLTEGLVQERLVRALGGAGGRFMPDPDMISSAELDTDGRLMYASFRLVCALAGLDPMRSGPLVNRAMSLFGWERTSVSVSGVRVARWIIPEAMRPLVPVNTKQVRVMS